MTYKSTQVYVVMREMYDDVHDELNIHPVAVFTDLETAEGNAEGYNLSMNEQKLDDPEGSYVRFYVNVTIMYS